MKTLSLISSSLVAVSLACDSCYGPVNHIEHVRHVKRIQPGAHEATYGPTRPLEWGQLNVLHTVSWALLHLSVDPSLTGLADGYTWLA